MENQKKGMENTEKSEKGLLRLTKKELVSIILRKDDTEHNLRKDLEGTENTLETIKQTCKEYEIKLNTKTHNFEQLCNQYSEITTQNKHFRHICFGLGVVILIEFILLLLM